MYVTNNIWFDLYWDIKTTGKEELSQQDDWDENRLNICIITNKIIQEVQYTVTESGTI